MAPPFYNSCNTHLSLVLLVHLSSPAHIHLLTLLPSRRSLVSQSFTHTLFFVGSESKMIEANLLDLFLWDHTPEATGTASLLSAHQTPYSTHHFFTSSAFMLKIISDEYKSFSSTLIVLTTFFPNSEILAQFQVEK